MSTSPPVVPPQGPVDAVSDELPAADLLSARSILREGFALVRGLARRRPWPFLAAVLGSLTFVAGILATAEVVGSLTEDLLVPVLVDGEDAGPRVADAVLLLLGVGVWRAVGVTIRRAGAGFVQFGALSELRVELVDRQLELPMRWYASQRVGDLLAVNETHARRSTHLMGPLPFAVGAIALVLGVGAVAWRTDPLLGLVVTGLLVVAVVFELAAAWAAFAMFSVEQHRRTLVSRAAHESVDGAATVRSLGAREHEVRRVAVPAGRLRDAEVEVGRRFSYLRAGIEAMPAVLAVPVLLVGATRISEGAMQVGDLVTVAYLLSLLSFPLAIVGFLLWDVADSLPAWRRVDAVRSADGSVVHGSDDRHPGDAGHASVEGVAFAYDTEVAVLRDLDLDLGSGGTVAVVGATASGKSTLLLLLARLWDPDEGAVRLDGRDLRDLDRGSRTSQVALVPQEAFLFDDTVRGNITMGRTVPDEVLDAALVTADAVEIVAGLPDGLETHVGERGVTLSGGQRQRIAIARALVGRPRLLLLDDATSALDPSVEQRVLDALASADRPTTTVLVGTRPATIARCDRVVLLESGRVVAIGTHERLLVDEPSYARLLRAYEDERGRRAEGRTDGAQPAARPDAGDVP